MSAHRIDIDDLIGQRFASTALDLSSRRRVLTDLAGTHVSGFRGRGMEFEEHRPYVAGDEVRAIDWRVTARTGQTHVRLYREERERPIIIAVDLRPPMWFGTRGCFKAVLAARTAARFGWAASANGDRIGGLRFDQRHREIRPGGGRRGLMRLFHLLAQPVGEAEGALPLASAADELRRVARPGALIVLLSDFHDLGAGARKSLLLTARHCELVFGMVSDPLERRPPPPGRFPVRGPDERPRWLDSRARATARRWQQSFEAREQAARDCARACRAHWLPLDTGADLGDQLGLRFGRRQR